MDEPDAPLVQSLVPGSTESFEDQLGQIIGTRKARVSGTVESVKPGMISVRDSDGKLHKHDLYNNFPLNRKTYLQHNPQVSAGDKVKSGGILASSNFTDDKGTL
ncbi:MAG: hypothetical protein GTO54_02700, partial [Nitrososphaeria archaeon]|nr:hypothetical protein [Nitrososphaeria archaeon]